MSLVDFCKKCVRVCVYACVHACLSVYALLSCQYQEACIEITAIGFIYTVLVACQSYPCTDGGVCTVTANGYKCACKDNYFGRNCQREFLFYRPIFKVYLFP